MGHPCRSCLNLNCSSGLFNSGFILGQILYRSLDPYKKRRQWFSSKIPLVGDCDTILRNLILVLGRILHIQILVLAGNKTPGRDLSVGRN